MADPVRTQVNEQLANAVKGHPWLQEIFAGRAPGPVGTDDAINGLVSLAPLLAAQPRRQPRRVAEQLYSERAAVQTRPLDRYLLALDAENRQADFRQTPLGAAREHEPTVSAQRRLDVAV
jgi:hypothetical protein